MNAPATIEQLQAIRDAELPNQADDFRDLPEDAQFERLNAAFSKALGITNDEFSNADNTVFDLLAQVREYMAFGAEPKEKPLRLAAIGLAIVVAVRERLE
jgi:hypothetical protein